MKINFKKLISGQTLREYIIRSILSGGFKSLI